MLAATDWNTFCEWSSNNWTYGTLLNKVECEAARYEGLPEDGEDREDGRLDINWARPQLVLMPLCATKRDASTTERDWMAVNEELNGYIKDHFRD